MAKDTPLLVVLIPAFNEEKTIGEAIDRIPSVKGCKVKPLVVDDGSTDETAEIAEKAKAHVLRLGKNRGLGIAFKQGILKALELGADYVVNMDADLQFRPEDIGELIKPVLDGRADVAICSRFLDKSLEPEMPYVKKVGNKIFSKLISRLTDSHLTDTQCGFRAYTKDAALRITSFSKYTYTQETIVDLLEKGVRIKEVPLKVRGERDGRSRVVDNVLSYALRSCSILVRTVRDLKALEFFGLPGAAMTGAGSVGLGVMFIRWVVTGVTLGYKNVINASILLVLLGFLLMVLSLQADMLSRQRMLLDETNYRLKKREYS